MKIKLIVIIVAMFSLAYAACTKCKTCVPHIAPYTSTSPASTYAQKVKLCRKAEIDAYENLNNFVDGGNDTVKFLCN